MDSIRLCLLCSSKHVPFQLCSVWNWISKQDNEIIGNIKWVEVTLISDITQPCDPLFIHHVLILLTFYVKVMCWFIKPQRTQTNIQWEIYNVTVCVGYVLADAVEKRLCQWFGENPDQPWSSGGVPGFGRVRHDKDGQRKTDVPIGHLPHHKVRVKIKRLSLGLCKTAQVVGVRFSHFGSQSISTPSRLYNFTGKTLLYAIICPYLYCVIEVLCHELGLCEKSVGTVSFLKIISYFNIWYLAALTCTMSHSKLRIKNIVHAK